MLLVIVLLGAVGVCAGLAFLSEESLGNLRAKALEAKRWILLKLDSLGQPPDVDSDCDCCDLEAGFGEAREPLVDNGSRAPTVQLKPIRPIRRSVRRGSQGSGSISTSTHVSTSPRSEYGGLYDHTPDKAQQQQDQQKPPLLRPTLTTAISLGGGSPHDGNRAPRPHHPHRRGMSFDINAASADHHLHHHHHHHHHHNHHPNETSSARGSFALPRPAAFQGAADAEAFSGDGVALPANVVAAFAGGRGGGGGTVEQQIPVYIPLQKIGSLSKATHRRSSSRGADGVGVCVGIGVGSVSSASAAGRSTTSPPESSPFRGCRSPAKVLPPVPAFAGAAGGDLEAAPPPPPPSWNLDQDGGGGGLAVGDAGLYGSVQREQMPGRSPRQLGGSGAVISPVPFAPDRQGAAPTTPKQELQHDHQQDAPSGRGSSFFAGPSPDGDNSFSHIDYVANYVADSMAGGGGEAGKPRGEPSFWDGSGGRGSSSDAYAYAYDKQLDERAPISVLPSSPAWSAEDDVNRGTGVRRRLSPRAAGGGGAYGAGGTSPRGGGGMSPRAGGGVSPRAGGGVSPRAGGVFSPRAVAGGGARSPRRAGGGAGWAQPIMSPRKREYGGGAGRGNQRSLARAFSEEGSAAAAAAGERGTAADACAGPAHRGTRELRIDVGAAEEHKTVIVAAAGAGGGTVGAGAPPPVSPMNNAHARAKTPLAGAPAEAGTRPKVGVASAVPEAAAAEKQEEAAAAAAAAAETLATESTLRQVGLRCSTPLYDRGRNMLGRAGEGGSRDGDEDGQGAPLPPTEKRGGGGLQARRGGGDVSGRRPAGSSAVRDSRAKETGVAAADSAAPPPAVAEGAEPQPSAQGGVQQHQKDTGEQQARKGRDLSSSQAFEASLDLPFEQLDLTELIGGGGFGQVYRGVWRGTPVAVKVLVPVAQRDLDEELAADFRAEVLMLAALRHPNVCLFMGACMVPPNRAIVTELLTRGSLWEALRADRVPAELASASAGSHRGASDGRHDESSILPTPQDCWPWSVVVKVAEGVACGMWYLHQHEPFPILHRDLKSANLLLDECFNVKICDFGLARLKAFTTSATMTGNCGTVQWMAPEVLASEKYAEPADVFSFAIVCWELLSRACPYDGMSQIQVAVAVLNDGLRPEIPDWCPREFASLIKNGWDQDPTERPSFGDVLAVVRKSPA